MRKFALAFLVYALVLSAQTVDEWHQGMIAVPATAAVAVAVSAPKSVRWDKLVLANVSGSSVTVTITDNSLNCNNGPCQPWPAITLAPNTNYIANMLGLPMAGGIIWQASSANAVHGWVAGRFN